MAIKKAQKVLSWPPRCRLNFYVPYGRGLSLDESSTDRSCDLGDITDMLMGNYKSRTIYFGLSGRSKKWLAWDEACLQNIEKLIKYDLTFDGEFRVLIARDTIDENLPCTEEFIWKLNIRRTGSKNQ
jgi:hypothetical protein